MSLFAPVANVAAPVAADNLGGFAAIPSGIYNMVLKLWYVSKTAKQGTAFNYEFADPAGKVTKFTLYPTSTKSGTEQTTYLDADKKPQYLPDYLMACSIAVLTTGKQLHELVTEDKLVKIRNKETKTDVPTKMPVYTEALGKPIKLGILRVIENKTVKSGNSYVPTEGTKESNKIDKCFHPTTNQTLAEITAGTEALFIKGWETKNKDVDQNLVKAVAGAPNALGDATANSNEDIFATK